MAKYSSKAQSKVGDELHRHKHQGKWQSRKQAIAVGLAKARRSGGKVPPEK